MTKELSNTLELAGRGLADNIVSSAEHSIDKFANEASNVKDEEYTLPTSYGLDTLKCMSVNVNTTYVYWEVTPELKEKFASGNSELLLKLFSDEDSAELVNFFITDLVSNRFINVHLADRSVYAVIGAVIDGSFVEMLRSNTIKTPSDDITLSTDELWMSKSEHMDQIIKASSAGASNQPSSFGIVKELELIKKHNESVRLSQTQSSFSLSSKE